MADSLSMNIPAAAFIIILLVVMFRQYGMQLTMHFASLQKTQKASINPAFSPNFNLLNLTCNFVLFFFFKNMKSFTSWWKNM